MIKDVLKNEILVGDKIAYPCRSGSRCWLETAVILELSGSTERPVALAEKENGKKVTLTAALKRCVRVADGSTFPTKQEESSSKESQEFKFLSRGQFEHEVLIPFTGSICTVVQTDNEYPEDREVLELLYEQFAGIDLVQPHPHATEIMIESFDFHERISQGNVLYADVNEIEILNTNEV